MTAIVQYNWLRIKNIQNLSLRRTAADQWLVITVSGAVGLARMAAPGGAMRSRLGAARNSLKVYLAERLILLSVIVQDGTQ
jgi:hypothetical protein